MKSAFPDWEHFTSEFAASELKRLLKDAETRVAGLEAASPATYEGFVWALDDATRELWRVWGMVAHELGVMNSEAWRKVQNDFQQSIVAFGLRVSQSRKLYEISKSVLAGLPPEAKTRRRIVAKMVESAELSGVALEGEKKARFNEIAAELAGLSNDFANTVIDSTAAFKFEKDGKTYTIDDANYPETMKHCPDREVRETLYRARSTRSRENDPRIARILALRQEEARLLSFPDAATRSLQTKSAPSVKAVFDLIDKLDAATLKGAEREERELGDNLAPWDVAFAAERLREKKFSYSEEELKRHFPFDRVLQGLFRLTKFLFDVDVEEITGAEKPSVWHRDVRFFAVREGGETIAHFYLDSEVRPGLKGGGAWMNEFRNRSVRGSEVETPLAVLVLNTPKPNGAGEVLLPLREVETLFHEFGHALQCMLTRIDEEDAAGINLVEWDAVEVASQFMENWCLDDHTRISLPEELKARVRAAKNFRAASACRRQLAFAKTDLLLHSASFAGDANAVKTAQFAHFGLKTIPEDRFLSSFTHIFAGGYSAGYYGYKWAEVMSADAYGAFEEAGLGDDAALQATGRKYRQSLLALGGSKSALEVFREFRGRDPEIDSLLRQQDLV